MWAGCLERTVEGTVLDDRTVGSGLDAITGPTDALPTLADRMMAGVCAIDLDGAPPLDLFFARRTDGSGAYRATGEGYAPVPSVLDLSGLDPFGCLAVDLTGDDRDDLVVSGAGGVTLFVASASGTFERRTLVSAPAPILYTGIAAGDLDGDLDLDLVIAGFVDASSAPTEDCGMVPCGLALAEYRGVPNVILIRDGDDFTDRTAELAPDMMEAEPTLVVLVVDLEGDGVPEILVGNDLGAAHQDRLLVREGGVYVDQAMARGFATNSTGFGMDTMGYSVGDVNGDGRLDVAATDFHGHPSAVFLCDEEGECRDRGRTLGLFRSNESFRWGNALVDLDLDGDLDLIEATGHLFTEAEGQAFGFPLRQAQPPNVWENLGDGAFARLLGSLPSYEARGLTVMDVDDDGAPDVVLATRTGPPALLMNVAPRRGHSLAVTLVGRAPNTDAVGAVVELTSYGVTQLRVRLAGEGYLGSFDPRMHFGVPSDGPVRLRARWPSGSITEHEVGVDGEARLIEP